MIKCLSIVFCAGVVGLPASAVPVPGGVPAASAAVTEWTPAQVKHQADQIDGLVLAGLRAKGQTFNAPVTEEVFLRRAYLDAIGRVPTAAEAAAYLADAKPDRRAQLIARLLASPGHGSHQFNWLADLLRVKDNFNNKGGGFVYENWLKAQLDANRPWDALVRDMLTADGKLCDSGAAGFLLRDSDMPLDGASYMMSTLLGANLACAQCHNHPFADWTQKDFYRMAAFFGATQLRDNQAGKQAQRLIKRGEVDDIPKPVARRIVFNNILQVSDGSRQKLTLPANYKYDDDKPLAKVTPTFVVWSPGEEEGPAYRAADAAHVKPEALRQTFATWLTHPANPRFAANIANREWKRFFGLAAQEPMGDLDDLSRAANPRLLAGLADLMRQTRFDLRLFERVLMNTRAYQSAASPMSAMEQNTYLFPGPLVRRMSAEQAWDSIVALGVGPEVDGISEMRGEAQKALNVPGNRFTPESLQAAADKVRATGLVSREFLANPKALDKKQNRELGRRQRDALLAQYVGPRPRFSRAGLLVRASELQQPAPETHFLRVFGQSDRLVADGGAFDGSIPQALMLMNGPVADIVTDRRSAVLAAAKAQTAPEAQVRTLYLAFFSRPPSLMESAEARAALKNGLSLADLTWVLLNAHEFLFIQ